MDVLLSAPLARRTVMMGWLAGLSAIVLLAVTLGLLGILIQAGALVFGAELAPGDTLAGVLNLWPLSVFFGGVAALVAGASGRSGVVTGVGAGVLAVMYFVEVLGNLSDPRVRRLALRLPLLRLVRSSTASTRVVRARSSWRRATRGAALPPRSRRSSSARARMRRPRAPARRPPHPLRSRRCRRRRARRPPSVRASVLKSRRGRVAAPSPLSRDGRVLSAAAWRARRSAAPRRSRPARPVRRSGPPRPGAGPRSAVYTPAARRRGRCSSRRRREQRRGSAATHFTSRGASSARPRL